MQTLKHRWESLAGILFGALLVTGGLLASRGLPYGAAASEVARFFDASRSRIIVGGALVMLSAAPLLWFVACLRRRLEADGDDGHLVAVVGTAGGAGAAVVLVGAASLTGTVSRTDFAESVAPAGAAAAWDLFGTLLGTALPVAMAVLVAATAVAARRSGWFAPWAAWLSWALAAGLLALPVAWMFASVAVLWVAAVAVAMTLRGPVQTAAPGTGDPTPQNDPASTHPSQQPGHTRAHTG